MIYIQEEDKNSIEKVTLIKYAAYCGSIQTFQFLLLNNVELEPSLWIYAIHGNNPEIIHLIEENKIEPEDKTYHKCFIESIKCHHNDIANYIRNNFLENEEKENTFSIALKYHNFAFISIDLINQSSFLNFCKYDYPSLIYYLLILMVIDVNQIKILFQTFS